MRPKSLILLSLALGCGLVAALGINQMMAKQQPVVVGGETQDIFVALKDCNINDPLEPTMLKLEAWPKDKIPAGALTKLEDVQGRRAKTRLYAGEPILDAKLLEKGDAGQGATDHIPAGFRVVGVRVDAVSSTGNLIKPGDRVDAIVYLTQAGRSGVSEAVSRTFLQDVRVFAVNEIFDRDPANGNAKVTAQTISLLVKPPDVELVNLAAQMGKIHFSLRSPSDQEKHESDGTDLYRLMGDKQQANRSEETANLPANPLTAALNALAPKPPEPKKPFKMTIILGPEVQELELDADSKLARMISKEGAVTHPQVDQSTTEPPADNIDQPNATPQSR